MKLTFINGSPRGASSNTDILMGHFIEGFLETQGNSVETFYIIKERPGFENIISFPLYVDAMPGSVKEFIEALAPLKGARPDLTVMYLVQNGFPETAHNRYVERYCKKLTQRLGFRYGGTICKGGCEGLSVQPPFLVEKVFNLFKEVGRSFGSSGVLDSTLLAKLAHPEHLKPENVKQVIQMVNGFLWDQWMKKNGVEHLSFAKPYGEDL
jgi:hypothetical protein